MSQQGAEAYDAIVIGAGQSGGPLSSALARAGRDRAVADGAKRPSICPRMHTNTHQWAAPGPNPRPLRRQGPFVRTRGQTKQRLRRARRRFAGARRPSGS